MPFAEESLFLFPGENREEISRRKACLAMTDKDTIKENGPGKFPEPFLF
jgi:hypothetical protein